MVYVPQAIEEEGAHINPTLFPPSHQHSRLNIIEANEPVRSSANALEPLEARAKTIKKVETRLETQLSLFETPQRTKLLREFAALEAGNAEQDGQVDIVKTVPPQEEQGPQTSTSRDSAMTSQPGGSRSRDSKPLVPPRTAASVPRTSWGIPLSGRSQVASDQGGSRSQANEPPMAPVVVPPVIPEEPVAKEVPNVAASRARYTASMTRTKRPPKYNRKR